MFHAIDENCFGKPRVIPFTKTTTEPICKPVKGVNKTNEPIIDESDVRGRHIGNSDYSTRTIQPWDVWLEYDLNGWDCDIIKRLLRTKEDAGMSPTEQRIMDYNKIIHNCQERIRQLES